MLKIEDTGLEQKELAWHVPGSECCRKAVVRVHACCGLFTECFGTSHSQSPKPFALQLVPV